MKSKTFDLDASAEEAALIAGALHSYAHTAYPPGGSECSQVARETLLESARAISDASALGRIVQLRRRQRPLFKAALRWYFSDEGPGNANRCKDLLAKIP